ncbi:GNAT family N-acetyltransferase [Bacillus solimangrovi]
MIELDCEFITSFSNRVIRDWGIIFFNENQPTYYDANHAHIWKKTNNPNKVIEEVTSFFQSKNLIPRFYLYDIEKQNTLILLLKSKGFSYENLVSPVQVWDGQISYKPVRSGITIEQVTKENYEESLEIQCSIKEFGGKSVREKAFANEFSNPNFTYYLLRSEGVACSTACLFTKGNQAQVECVATLEEYRGKGLIGELIRYIQIESVKQRIEKLWIFPTNEKISQVYRKYGFETLAEIKSGHAFLGGESIKEIRS